MEFCHICNKQIEGEKGMRIAMIAFEFSAYNTNLPHPICAECERVFIEVFRKAKNLRSESEYQKELEQFVARKRLNLIHEKNAVRSRIPEIAAGSGSIPEYLTQRGWNYSADRSKHKRDEQIHWRF